MTNPNIGQSDIKLTHITLIMKWIHVAFDQNGILLNELETVGIVWCIEISFKIQSTGS